MGNKQNVEAVTSRGTGRIKETHENFKLVGIRAESLSCDLLNTKHDCFFAQDSKSEAQIIYLKLLPTRHMCCHHTTQHSTMAFGAAISWQK